MKIGSGWDNFTNEGKEYISVAIDDAIKEIYPELKNLSFGLSRIPVSEAQPENSPNWSVTIAKKKETKKQNGKDEPTTI